MKSLHYIIKYFLFFAVSSYCYDAMPIEEIDKKCKKIMLQSLPLEDTPSTTETKNLNQCISQNYYYGIGQSIDYERARKCAYIELKKSDLDIYRIQGAQILMMIYGNGYQVKKNIPLAKKFACQIDSAPAEKESRLTHLSQIEKTQNKIDICDDITSGLMMGVCTHLWDEIKSQDSTKEFKKLIGKWNNNQKNAYEKLNVIFNAFVNSHLSNEIDLSGSNRTALQIEEKSQLINHFQSSFLQFENKKFPLFSDNDFIQIDKKLNMVYSKIMKLKDPGYGTINRKGIKLTELNWIKYRDEFVKFATINYPKIKSAAWKAWLTQERISQLEQIYDQLNDKS
ncbi:DUF1311 domain-containing protein [Silvanigrella aquatica]|uniref:Lysozyme inhibitor LprI N-terminal domain-containing protein n=1 Tax=Silvanigrella aquatica TaxID=1915309 RepID=A0A1L4D058_9BACT|nr:DUF1311 domain-containing protein [Silvanigrella aquatica]APJ03567.1 hypothetical protein AXG55_06455 [Silvanigrella aquatica]